MENCKGRPAYVTTSMYEFVPTNNIEEVNSVWVYINKSKHNTLITSEDISIYSGNIRKKITIEIP